MEFTKPTNLNEMYNVLEELFFYYRIRREPFEEPIIPELTLERMEFTKKTQAELKEEAKTLLKDKHLKEIRDYRNSLIERKKELEYLIEKENINKFNLIDDLINRYDASFIAMKKEASLKGLNDSSVISYQINLLNEEKNKKINQVNENNMRNTDVLTAELEDVDSKIINLLDHFVEIHSAEIDAKVIELTKEQEEREREVFTYNNSIEEKCQKYARSVATTNATLKIKYLEINSEYFSKEQLIDMGYYADVIDCVCAYYDTLPVLTAYQDLASENKLAIYLDDFYQDIVYMYKSRAGL
jgi:hypothetical protein